MSRFWKLILLLTLLAATAGALLYVKHRRDRQREKDLAEEIPLELDEALIKKTISRLGAGFMVWERFRNDRWEIWVKKLSGGKEKRLVPAEKDRDHFCPKISPDGRILTYLSFPRRSNAYPSHAGTTAALWMMNLNSRRRHVIADAARSYAEDRAVTWLDNDRLCYIDGAGYTMEYNIRTSERRRLLNEPHDSFGYLVSPDRKHATTGTPEFALYDPARLEIKNQQRMGGCQPYFTSDGKWGYWMGGAGGPINKMRLATREVGQVLERDDPRLNGKRNYVYFPMVSPCQRLMAFAASPDKHNHFTADYDIYLAHVHPITFEIIGNPVRYTKYGGVDRFPDVFRRELPLGSHYVEGRTEMKFKIPAKYEGEDWEWYSTGRFQAQGRVITRVFERPGEYWVEAKRGELKLRGYVNVGKPSPPKVDGERREGKDGILVDFDEPVDASGARVTLAGGKPVEEWKVVDDGYVLQVKLPPGTPESASLELEGFRDHANEPNVMAKTSVSVPSVMWPAAEDGMLFVWENLKGRTSLPDGTPCEVTPSGLAFWSEAGAMKLRGGWFDAPRIGGIITEACRKSGEMMVEMIVTPQPGPFDAQLHPIVTLANDDGVRNFTIGQKGTRLHLQVRTTEGGADDVTDEAQLAGLEDGKPHHLVIGYRKDKVTIWIDGSEVWNRSRIKGTLENWEPGRLRFGATLKGEHPWRGLIDRVVIYDHLLPDQQITQHSNSSIVAESHREPLKSWKVVARLVEASPVPTLQEFQPYTEALTRHLYEVLKVKEGGPLPDKQIAVSQWVWLGSQALDAQRLKVGDVVELTIHREENHPELKSLFVKDDLIEGLAAERYHDAGDWDAKVVPGQTKTEEPANAKPVAHK